MSSNTPDAYGLACDVEHFGYGVRPAKGCDDIFNGGKSVHRFEEYQTYFGLQEPSVSRLRKLNLLISY